MKDISTVEDNVQPDIFLFDIDILDRSTVDELARRSLEKQTYTVRLLRYNSHICYVFSINTLLEA